MRSSTGLDVTWQQRGDLLLGQVRNAAQLLRKARKLPPTTAGVKVDTVEMADALDERCNALEAALEGVKREERAAQATFQDRELVARVWERTYPGVAEIFTAMCILAGRDELAARVKPTVRKTRSRGGKDATSTTTSNGAVMAPTASGNVAAPTSHGEVAAPGVSHTDVVTH